MASAHTSSFVRQWTALKRLEAMRPAGNDDPILRWNGCARIINRNNLEPSRHAGRFYRSSLLAA
ncbi:MAG: hypothetical protein IPP63_18955 [Chloracidobacterium sp.]|nr:hypothetical protein [Chloracidobacterium sp.]